MFSHKSHIKVSLALRLDGVKCVEDATGGRHTSIEFKGLSLPPKCVAKGFSAYT